MYSKDSSTSQKYLDGLIGKYKNSTIENVRKKFLDFEIQKKPITQENKKNLLMAFPDAPKSLLEILEYSDGFSLGSFQSDIDGGEHPYYLLSSSEQLEKQDIIKDYSDIIAECKNERITKNTGNAKWLLFAEDDNYDSYLFIDFTPSEKGKKGQIIRYMHDPDNLTILADSFDEFLQKIISSDYAFFKSLEKTTQEFLSSKNPEQNTVKNFQTKSEKQLNTNSILCLSLGCIGLLPIILSSFFEQNVIPLLLITTGVSCPIFVLAIIAISFNLAKKEKITLTKTIRARFIVGIILSILPLIIGFIKIKTLK